jgi:hypothetical protein
VTHIKEDRQLLCSICNEPIQPDAQTGWSGGHNAEPINKGRCCGDCNASVVVPERLRRIYDRKQKVG